MAEKILTKEDRAAAERLRKLYEQWQQDRIKRGEAKLSQEQVGERLGGITQGAVSQYLLGKTPLGADITVKWALLLGVRPQDIRPDFELMVAETGGDYIIFPSKTGENPRLSLEETERRAAEYAMAFVDLFEQTLGEKITPADKLELFNRMKNRYMRQLMAGQNLPDEKRMDNEVADFMHFYRMRHAGAS